MNAKHLLALSRGIEPGDGGLCAVCGDTPFDSAGPRTSILGPNFTAFDLLEGPYCESVCTGCKALLSGRPGDDPPPLRTTSYYADYEVGRIMTLAEIWAILIDPPHLHAVRLSLRPGGEALAGEYPQDHQTRAHAIVFGALPLRQAAP